MLLGLFISPGAFAQDAYDLGFTVDLTALATDGYTVDDQSPLITDVWEQLYGEEGELNPCCDPGEGSEWALLGEAKPDEVTNRNPQDFWHSNWHNGDQPAGSHYLQVMMTDDLDPDDLIMFAFTRRNADNDHTIVWLVMGTDDPEATKNECEEIALIETPFSSNRETLLSTPFKRGEYQYLRFYSEEQWGAGYGTRGYFHMSRFNIFPAVKLEETDVAWNQAMKLYDDYSAAYDSFYGRTGTDPGDYSEEAVQAFLDAYDAYDNLYDATAAQIFAWCDQLVAAYDAIAPTKVPFTSKNLPSGYYRIKAGMMYYDGDKYMMGYRSDGKLWGIWATPDFDELQDNIQALWKITPVTETTFDVVNMYHDGRFLPVERSTSIEMSKESDNLLSFDAVATNHDEDISYVNIRLADQEADGFVYLHQGGHQNGAGITGYLVGWCNSWSTNNGCGATEWYFEPVAAAEAEAIIAAYDKGEDEWRDNYKVMMKEIPEMISVAKDVQKIVDEEKPAVSDEYPITSPCSDSAEGQYIEYLWDGNTANFWHSDWHGEFTNEEHHYFQVELPNPEDYASAVFTFTRRNTTSGNQIYKWNVVGFDEDDFELVQEDGELLAEIETPYHVGNITESYISDVFSANNHQYLRFYCMGTKSNDGGESQDKFMHLAEFQVYPGRIYQSPTCQYVLMGDIATNLEAIYEELKDVEAEDVATADYGRLKAAYDAFVANYVNPQDLRETMTLAENQLQSVVEGSDPGFYPVGSTAALTSALADAKAYDEAGAYTRSESDEFIASLYQQMAILDASPIRVQEGKWYRIRFGTEEEYDTYGWNKTGNYPNYFDNYAMYNAGLFGKYIAVAQIENEVIGWDNWGDEVYGNVVVPIAKDRVALNQTLHGIELNQLSDQDMALFRFVNIGDRGYAIQNKATGLYISNGGSLSVQPGLFIQHPSGYGQNAFFNRSLEGNYYSPLHLAQSQTVLCSWGNESGTGWTDDDGRRGSFFVEEVADVLPSYSYGDYKMKVIPGEIYSRCYAVPVTLKNQEQGTVWTVDNVERTFADNSELVQVNLAQITEPVIPAGQPFFYIAADEFDDSAYDEEGYAYADFSFSSDFVYYPQNDGFLKGNFDEVYLDERFITCGQGHEDEALIFHERNTTLVANRAYIIGSGLDGEPFSRRAELEFSFGGEVVGTLLGDANCDGSVDVVDVTTTVDFILGKAQPNARQFKSTDVNKDNTIDVVDLTSIVSIILGTYRPVAAPAKAPARIQTNDVLLVDGSDLALLNARQYVAFQMDVTLSDGAVLNGVQLSERAAGKEVTFHKMAGNTYRILVYSFDNSSFTGNEGTLLSLNIVGNQQATFSNVLFSDGTKAYSLGTQVATGINGLAIDAQKTAVYDLNGRRISNLKTGGVYITNGKTKVVK